MSTDNTFNDDDEIKYQLLEAKIIFEAPEDLSIDEASGALHYHMEQFDRHSVIQMDFMYLSLNQVSKEKQIMDIVNESRLLAALLERGKNASIVNLPLSAYDLVLEIKGSDMIRIQVKTVGNDRTGSVRFSGGTRGGVDKTFKSSEKEYVQSTETSDAVIGVSAKKNNGDTDINFYIVPTIFIERLSQKSISINKIPMAKNNWELLYNCKDPDYVNAVFFEA